jgi:trimeric autotransporter adhesin
MMNKIHIKSFFILLFWFLPVASYSQDTTQIIYPFAGNGYDAGMGFLYGGYTGDGGPATDAELNWPGGIALDNFGNIYISDCGNHVVRKVDASGIITTFAGNGAGAGTPFYNYSGDGGPATDAELGENSDLAIDASGNVYIADGGCERIRKVSTAGIINVFAGNGIAGYSGDGGPATAAEIWNPFSITVNAFGSIYIADLFNNRIRLVDTSGIISTFAGNGYGSPGGGYSGDGGPATAAELHWPTCVAVDAFGNIYIADAQNHRVRKVNTSGIISTIAGDSASGYSGDGGQATAAELAYPCGVIVDNSGNVLITDFYVNRIRKVNTKGIISTVTGNGTAGYYGDGGPATDAELNSPASIAIDTLGMIYIADAGNNRIRKVALGVYTPPHLLQWFTMELAYSLCLPKAHLLLQALWRESMWHYIIIWGRN